MDQTASIKHLSDEEIATRTAEGLPGAFEELIYRYNARLCHFLRHKTQTDQDVEDIAQETFLKAFRNIDRFDPRRKFSTWLYTIAVRLAISHHRRKKPRAESSVFRSHELDPQEVLIRKERSQNLWHQAKTLQPKEYEALWLRYAEDISVKDIARVLKKRPLTVRVLLHRARLNLAKKMQPNAAAEDLEGPASVEHKLSIL